MAQASDTQQVVKRCWDVPAVRRIDAAAAENGRLIGPETIILRS